MSALGGATLCTSSLLLTKRARPVGVQVAVPRQGRSRFARTWSSSDPTVNVASIVSAKLHPAGLRSFTYDRNAVASVQELKALFEGGYDAVCAPAAANDVQARIQVDQARGVSPP